MTLVRLIGVVCVPIVACIVLVRMGVALIRRYVTQKRLPTIILAAFISAMAPALLFAGLLMLDDESVVAGFVGAAWTWSALLGALLAPSHGYLTLIATEVFWIALGALTAFTITSLRYRPHV